MNENTNKQKFIQVNPLELMKMLLAETEVDKMLNLAIDQLIQYTRAEHGLIILFDEKQRIIFKVARNLEKMDIENPQNEISHTIIDSVHKKGQVFWHHNALEDQLFNKSNSIQRLNILSVICLPLKHNSKTFGVVYLDSRTIVNMFNESSYNLAKSIVDIISLSVFKSLERNRLIEQNLKLENDLRTRNNFDMIIGNSRKMIFVMDMVSKVTVTNVPVLIEGETGTGKELIANAIHLNSPRKNNPLIKINCGALPENLLESELFGYEKGAFTGAYKNRNGLFEQANGGSLFLDELEEMPAVLQIKLLRILQNGEYNPIGSEETRKCDVRIIAATKTNLEQSIEKGNFRNDLYYRLNLIKINVPALRDRKDDISLLANYFFMNAIKDYSKSVKSISPDVIQCLENYNFPGNVRELENIIRRSVILCNEEIIKISHLPQEILCINKLVIDESISNITFKEAKQKIIKDFECRYIQQMLKKSNGVIKKAAEMSGMYQKNFHDKLKKYNINSK